MSGPNRDFPSLPGYCFTTKTDHGRCSQFDYKNGYVISKNIATGVGHLDADSVSSHHDPSLTYGKAKDPPEPLFLPQFVLLDGKCLSFTGYTIQTFEDPCDYPFRVRRVKISYFLIDDTIAVSEPAIENAGYVQGTVLKRCPVPNPRRPNQTWHWADFNIGVEVSLYSVTYKLCGCDEYTRQYLTNQGILVNPEEPMPEDPYIAARRISSSRSTTNTDDCDKASLFDKHQQFLKYDGVTLRFLGVWSEDQEESYEITEEYRFFVIKYYLADDQIDINELGDGKNQVVNSKFLKKMKLPKNWKTLPSIISYENSTSNDNKEYYKLNDFIIGKTIYIMGRSFLIYECDSFTRDYLKEVLQIVQPDPIEIKRPTKKESTKEIPPDNGFDDPDGSLQNC